PFANAASANSGVYTVDVFNDGGAVISSPVTLVVSNAPPTVGSDSLNVTQNMTTNFSTSVILANDSDPEMDPLSVAWVSGVAPVSYARNFNDGLAPSGGTIYPNAGLGASVKPTGGTGDSGYLEINPDTGNA